MIIAIGTKNRAKINAAQQAFISYEHQLVSISVPSGVSEQPFSDEETIVGAINRATEARKATKSHIGIGLEGGVHRLDNEIYICNWGALVASSISEPIVAGGARIRLPDEVARRLQAGDELGPVMDEYAHQQNVREAEGAVGIFTNGIVNRTEMFLHVMKLLIGQYEFQIKQ